ncbi:J domain-containing protein [Halarcobacter sp.]|uniref:J domain-containing protein n=1 Tax=Halarcobacter sp. TaxID=2321133 RepID=UPI003A904514
MAQLISSLIKWAIFFGILYLIFTNFGTFLIILFILVSISYYIVYQFKKKIREASSGNGQHFKFTFNGQDFSQANGANNFDFNDFQEQFRRGNFQGAGTSFGEVPKAKEFFGFTSDPTKEEIKKRYKELARKYHPDINDHGDELMQQLNHYKDVLLKAFP